RVLPQLIPQGDVVATNQLRLAIGLPLHHRDQLNALLTQLYDPHSTNFHQFLKPDDFVGRFGPTEPEYQAVVQFAQEHGLTVVGRHRNRLVLDVAGNASDIERAFRVHLRTYHHPVEPRTFFAPDTAPSVPANLPVTDIWGLSDYARPKPAVVLTDNSQASPQFNNGTGPGGSYLGRDFRNAYAHGSPLNGAGQTVALVEFDGYYPQDISNYVAQCGYSQVPLQNVYVDSVDGTPGYSGIANAVLEVSLDIELIIAMAPGLSRVIVYEGGGSPYDVYNSIATDNLARQISSSWLVGAGLSADFTGSGGTLDSILSEMAAQGQAFFQAAGDADAYTGSQTLNGSTGPIPVDSIYVTSVGGTSLAMNSNSTAYKFESVWNWGGNTGSGGGISTNYSIPAWQAPVNMTANSGSATNRNLPDVAMVAESVFVVHDNGQLDNSGAGTSCAAPLWAGYCALINQQSVGTSPGGQGAGFLNPALYSIGTSSNYTACFNDVTNGNNVGANTPGLFNAVPGYDLCTGWGSPAGTNLINAIAPLARPFFISQPLSLNVIAGTNVALSAAVSGASPIGYQWQFNGASLSDAGNLSGSMSNILSLTSVVTNEAGNYTLILSNTFGSVTSSIVALAIDLIPATGLLVSSENPSGYRDNLAFAVGVVPTNATGTIQFYTNGGPFNLAVLAAGQAVSTNLAGLPRGTNLITAVYSGDANDLAFTNNLLQVVTNHPPSALPAFFTRAAGASLVIPATNLATGWRDVDGDTVTLAAVTPSTNGVTVLNPGSGWLTYFNSNSVPDQFDVVITDGFGGTNYQIVNLAVVFPGITVVPGGNAGGVALNLSGAPGQTYILETTTNLTTAVIWLPVATNTLGTNGLWQFNDPQFTNYLQRFYRLSSSP
ncbi:MAG TPA: protease pro-enzyme activation domain-containing protein, partial [Candidatus Angelobacter sp.]|nr:protease pro-enzyme activation domain-containing protein [Candidatus Angelobacter sp.]